jgi:geranylgeranyl diphosphate synthase type I
MDFVFFTGFSCTGKTTISKLLEEREGYHFISTHIILSKIAREAGFKRSREMYKSIGINKEMLLVTEYIIQYLKENQFDKVVIDDIFDNNLLYSLYHTFQDNRKLLISFESNHEKRLERMAERLGENSGAAQSELNLYDTVKNEAGIADVMPQAMYSIQVDVIPIEEVYQEVLKIIESESGDKKNFKSYLSNSAIQINACLKYFFDNWINSLSTISGKLNELLSKFYYACENGKRLRGFLVRLGYNLVKEETNKTLLPAISYEVFQTAILAHDDIIDRSALRRGRPSLYMSLGGDHYGISQAISLGDLGLFLSNKIILDSDFDTVSKNAAISSLINTQYKTCIGEILDIELPCRLNNILYEDILSIYEYKTAYYTIIGPLQLGALLANGDEKLLSSIENFGKYLGIAFQIKDDILDIFGEKKYTGKATESDIEEGKITLLWYFANENADKNQKNILEQLYGKKNLQEHEISSIKDAFHKTGALEKCEAIMKEFTNKAKEQVNSMGITDENKNMLYALCDFLINRKK